MDINLILLHLSLIDGVGPIAVEKILLKRSSETDLLNEMYFFSISDLQKIFNLNFNVAKMIYDGLKNKQPLFEELELIEKNKIEWMSLLSSDYPFLLKNIHNPPTVLYWQGQKLSDDDKKISIIGSRKANAYAKNVIDQLVKPLVQNDWSIVSGGAIGADTMAHEATVKNQGKTIAIFGSGLLQPYPLSNKTLFKKIIENKGTILSSYPLLTTAHAGNFPARNRIISGISKGCIVVQANIKSGTRITAINALEQGREVFAVPGPIDDELSSGCHKLIQEGAKLVSKPEDVLVEFGECDDNMASDKTNSVCMQSNINDSCSVEISLESKILQFCKNSCSIEDLLEKSGLHYPELQKILFDLQLDGKIRQNFAGLWENCS